TSRAACGKRRASTVAGPRLMQGKRKRRHLHPVAVYFIRYPPSSRRFPAQFSPSNRPACSCFFTALRLR
ncbi:hypothetical protein V4S60_19725, partial [Citrobacter freundii]|uniref:hypothetical protein n=1 Tax=Citrobacter freundii TaxID=546 RepID=UPI002F962E1D